jgi:hypothetical protein
MKENFQQVDTRHTSTKIFPAEKTCARRFASTPIQHPKKFICQVAE